MNEQMYIVKIKDDDTILYLNKKNSIFKYNTLEYRYKCVIKNYIITIIDNVPSDIQLDILKFDNYDLQFENPCTDVLVYQALEKL